jgi:hypothetical protein
MTRRPIPAGRRQVRSRRRGCRRRASPNPTSTARSSRRGSASSGAQQVFLANLGPPAEHGGRAAWIANLLAAGGIEAIASDSFVLTGGGSCVRRERSRRRLHLRQRR